MMFRSDARTPLWFQSGGISEPDIWVGGVMEVTEVIIDSLFYLILLPFRDSRLGMFRVRRTVVINRKLLFGSMDPCSAREPFLPNILYRPNPPCPKPTRELLFWIETTIKFATWPLKQIIAGLELRTTIDELASKEWLHFLSYAFEGIKHVSQVANFPGSQVFDRFLVKEDVNTLTLWDSVRISVIYGYVTGWRLFILVSRSFEYIS